MRNHFADYHPIVNFIFFWIVLLISMFSMHPVLIVISLMSSIIYSLCLKGWKKTGKNCLFLLGMAVMIMVINPLFNHQGVTVLYFFESGNALTLESVIYGLFMAMMLSSVILWFGCYNEVMTSDKFIFLFGRIAPHFSLVLSMIFRFVPRFKDQFKEIRTAQKCLGRDVRQGDVFERIGHFSKELSIMISWSMENSIETADSMKARGYGLADRSSYGIYSFKRRDGVVLAVTLGVSVAMGILSFFWKMHSQYFPWLKGNYCSVGSITCYGLFLILCMIPVIVDFRK